MKNEYMAVSVPVEFIKLIDKTIKKRNNRNEPCIILKPELIEDLDELPLINLDLYKRYRKTINKLYIDFSRFEGALFTL